MVLRIRLYCVHSCEQRSHVLVSTMTSSSSSSSSSSSGSESEGHHKTSKKGKKEHKAKKDKDKRKDKHKRKDNDKHKDNDNKPKHGESSGLSALGVIQSLHKSEDYKHDGSRAGHVPAAGVNPQQPHVLGQTHTTTLLSQHRGHNSTHGASSVHVSGHSNPSVPQSSGFSSGHRVPLQAGDPLPSLHETGPAPFLDADGGPVFIGSALFGRSVHPCKIVPNVRDSEAFGTLSHIILMQLPQPCRVPYACEERQHLGRYDLLPFIPGAMEWVTTSGGRVPIGRHPIEGGYEEDRSRLYHAAARIGHIIVPGKTGAHLVRIVVMYFSA